MKQEKLTPAQARGRFGARQRGVRGTEIEAQLLLGNVLDELGDLVEGLPRHLVQRSRKQQLSFSVRSPRKQRLCRGMRLRAQLVSIATEYKLHAQLDQAVKNSNAKGTLRRLSKRAEELVRLVDTADDDTRDRLRESYKWNARVLGPSPDPSPDSMMRTFEAAARRFREATRTAEQQRSREKSRPEELRAARWLAGRLACLWEHWTRHVYKYSHPAAGSSSPIYGTTSSDWVARALRLIDSSLTEENIMTILPKEKRGKEARPNAAY